MVSCFVKKNSKQSEKNWPSDKAIPFKLCCDVKRFYKVLLNSIINLKNAKF